jgi:hypothetical protein
VKKKLFVLSCTLILGSLADSHHLFSGVVKSSYADLQLRPPANFSAFQNRPYHSQLGHSVFSVLPLSQDRSPLAWNMQIIYKKNRSTKKINMVGIFDALNWVWAIIKGPYDSRSGLWYRTTQQKHNHSWMKINCLLRSAKYNQILRYMSNLQRGYWSRSPSQLQEYSISNFWAF